MRILRIWLLGVLILASSATFAQFTANITATYGLNGKMPEAAVSVSTEDFCSNTDVQVRRPGSSSIGVTIGLPSLKDGLIDIFLNGGIINKGVFKPNFTPNFNCGTRFLNVSGVASTYLINVSDRGSIEDAMSGDVSFSDVLEIYSPETTTLELPFHVIASTVAAQTFCDESASIAEATASVTVSLGGSSKSAEGKSTIKGAFLDTKNIREGGVTTVRVRRGINRIPLTISGTLSAKSKVQGLNGLVVCASSSVATAGNSITVNYFTGVNGSQLLEGTTIVGVVTGIDYRNPTAVNPCIASKNPIVTLQQASCGLKNGGASLQSLDGTNLSNILWTNGSKAKSVSNLAPGDYEVSSISQSGCHSSIGFRIIDSTAIPSLLPRDTVIDAGKSIQLSAVRDELRDSLEFQWTSGERTNTISVAAPGKYSVKVSDTQGCSYTYSTTVFPAAGHNIDQGNIVTDFGFFYDDGGLLSEFKLGTSYSVSICPSTPDNFITLDIDSIALLSVTLQTILSIYDGKSDLCPLGFAVTQPATFTSSSPDGCLSVRFSASRQAAPAFGWSAKISAGPAGTRSPCFEQLTCNSKFTDPGGTSGTYAKGDRRVYTICPQNTSTNSVITLRFDSLDINDFIGANFLSVYDGVDAGCLLSRQADTETVYTASRENGGCLTVIFTADLDRRPRGKGWVGQISCRDQAKHTLSPCRISNNTTPTDECTNAPLIDNSNPYFIKLNQEASASSPGNSNAAFFCGIIHNNRYFKFVADDTIAVFEHAFKGGVNSLCDGYQVSVTKVEGTCSSITSQWKSLTCDNYSNLAVDTNRTIVKGLIPGEDYYIMIDGSYSSNCTVVLRAMSGVKSSKSLILKEEFECVNNEYFVTSHLLVKDRIDSLSYTESGDIYKTPRVERQVAVKDTILTSIGPYRSGSNYRLLAKLHSDTSTSILTIAGKGPACFISCGLAVESEATCVGSFGDSLVVFGNILGGTSPYSVSSPYSNQVIFSDTSSVFSILLPRSKIDPFEVLVHDYNGCEVLHILDSLPQCGIKSPCNDDVTVIRIDRFHVNLSSNCNIGEYSVYDASGRIVLYGLAQDGLIELELSTLSSGVYVISIQMDSGALVKTFVQL